jgi:hypothetical protein
MHKTLLNSNQPLAGARKIRLLSSLLPGTLREQLALADSNRGMQHLRHLTPGLSLSRELRSGDNKVTNKLHQQRTGMVGVQASHGHNKHKQPINGANLHSRHSKAPGHQARNKHLQLPLLEGIYPGNNQFQDRLNKVLEQAHLIILTVTERCYEAAVQYQGLERYALKKARNPGVSMKYAKNL